MIIPSSVPKSAVSFLLHHASLGRVMGIAAAVVLCAAMGASRASADPRVLTVTPSTTANYRTVSVYAAYTGDDNKNATARFEYKTPSASDWLPGMAFEKIPNEQRFAAFFFAQPDTAYQVRITVTDPDGIANANPMETTVTTRDDTIQLGSKRKFYVALTGADSNPGTEAAPYKTITRAASQLGAGDTIFIKAGTYRESVRLAGAAGSASNWITIQAYGNGPVILDGSDPAFLSTGGNRWTVHTGTVYKAPISYTPSNYLAVDGLRAYHFSSVTALVTGLPGISAGWTYSSGFLYIRTKDGSDPDNHVVQVAKLKYGVELSTVKYVRVQGLGIQYYGEAGVRCNGNDYEVVIEDNTFRNNRFAVRKIGDGGSFYTVRRNTISDTEVVGWPWSSVKKSDHEAAGIALFAVTRGAVIEQNTISGYFDGIDLNYWPPKLGYNVDSDIVSNTINGCGDDGAELEGSNQTNVRFWSNAIDGCLIGVSVNPVLRGPVYIARNVLQHLRGGGFKVGTSALSTEGLESVGTVFAFHNTVQAADLIGQDGDGVECVARTYKNQTYENNILYTGRYVIAHGDCASSNVTHDYNLMFTEDVTRFVQWDKQVRYPTLASFQSATGQAKHAVNAKPLFVDLAGKNLRLAPGSPGIDAGVPLVGFNDARSPWPSAGAKPDLGAMELGSP